MEALRESDRRKQKNYICYENHNSYELECHIIHKYHNNYEEEKDQKCHKNYNIYGIKLQLQIKEKHMRTSLAKSK